MAIIEQIYIHIYIRESLHFEVERKTRQPWLTSLLRLTLASLDHRIKLVDIRISASGYR